MGNCAIRFCDNQKIVNYTVASEDGSYPFINALNTVRSKIYKSTDKTFELIVDLTFPDEIRAFGIFGPLGQALGITEFATITIEANNVNDFTSPPLSVSADQNDQQVMRFFDDIEDTTYRFWKISIDDPGNPDVVSFGYIYLGDYTAPTMHNIDRGFDWVTVDPSTTQKSLNGTPYFDIRTKYDTFGGLNIAFLLEDDRKTMQQLYDRLGTYTPVIVSIDPSSNVTSDINQLTRLARFTSPFRVSHQVFEYFNVSFTLEEVI